MDQELQLKKQNLVRIQSLIKKDIFDENKMQSLLENGEDQDKTKRASHSGNMRNMRPVHKIFK